MYKLHIFRYDNHYYSSNFNKKKKNANDLVSWEIYYSEKKGHLFKNKENKLMTVIPNKAYLRAKYICNTFTLIIKMN